MCGSGNIETQPLLDATVLPESSTDLSASVSSSNGTSGANKVAAENGAIRNGGDMWSAGIVALVAVVLVMAGAA